MSDNYYYVTTPIYYANGRPHLGNTYTTTLADSLVRYHRFRGFETFFLTGTDEHGDKVQQAADLAGKSAYDYTTEVSELFKRTWADLGLEYSRFIRTTDADHKQVVRAILQRIYDKGDIYFGEYGGNYCVGCERFLTEKELIDGKCPDHQTPPTFVKEKNYFFKMAKYQERLIDHITNVSPNFIRPERYKNEVLAMLREPLEDLCISRPKSRLTWGIELPFDPDYVTYVWFDALINYLSGVGYPDQESFKRFWPVSEHLIAKDIVKPHGVFWPTMLMSAEIPLYKHLTVHGYWVTPTGKMSKSLGNVVNPLDIKQRFGMDAFRYFVLREMTFGLDGTFNQDAFETRYNADLANNLGNLVSRSIAMVERYRQSVVPTPDAGGELERDLRKNAVGCALDVRQFISTREIQRALERIWQLIDAANVYIDRTKPWALAKAKDEVSQRALDCTLYHQLETIRIIASLLTAFLPDASRRILLQLGFAEDQIAVEQTEEKATTWERLAAGTAIMSGPALFPRHEEKSIKMTTEAKTDDSQKEQAKNESAPDGLITYDDFARVQLRVGQILAAEKVEKSEKLVKLQVDLGEDSGPRQIVAGIAKHFAPESLVGRKIAVVANLKPAKLMGQESRGMLLAASDDKGNLELLTVGPALAPGSIIK